MACHKLADAAAGGKEVTCLSVRSNGCGVAYAAVMRTTKGHGNVIIGGKLQGSSKEAVLVALTWADLNVDRISRWVEARQPDDEQAGQPDLSVRMMSGSCWMGGTCWRFPCHTRETTSRFILKGTLTKPV